MKRRSLLRRLAELVLGEEEDLEPAGDLPAPIVPPAPLEEEGRAETALRELLDQLESAAEVPPDAAERILRVVDQIAAEVSNWRALELLERASERLDGLPELQLALAERLLQRQDFSAALPLLEELAHSDDHACRAQLLLGDYHRRQGDLRPALSAYEFVLARDFTYPRARSRADDLKIKLDRPVGLAAPTIFGPEDAGRAGRFVIQREIGRGGGGTVYLALDRRLERPVALKVLHPEVARRAEARTHLFCEARVAASLQHPQIVLIYDLDESANLVVMEYCAGGTLADLLARGPLAPPLALQRLVQITTVLDVVHRCGIVHRDLKPANLMLRRRGRLSGTSPLVLGDFGIAHATEEERFLPDPAPDKVLGSLAYVAPEQRRSADVDARADLYACGVILLEMLLGRVPLDPQQALRGVSPLEIQEPWQALEQLLADRAEPTIALARTLLDPRAERRPEGAAAVAVEARRLAHDLETLADRRALHRELQRRAGPAPRDGAVTRWLAEQATALGLQGAD